MWAALLVVRSMMGLATVPLHPASARMVGNWFQPGQTALANGLITGAALLGIACTYPVFGLLIDTLDWPGAFICSGLFLAALAGAWNFFGRDFPSRQAPAPAAPLGDHTAGWKSPASDSVPAASWRMTLRNRSLILLTLSYAAVGYFQYLFFYWIHYYFDHVMQLSKTTSRVYSALPVLGMAFSMPLGGMISDRLTRRAGERVGRCAFSAVSMLLSALFLVAGIFSENPNGVVVWFTLSLSTLGAL